MNEFVFIIPVYNCEQTIQHTLLSVLVQPYSNWKIIVRDDLSTDKTFERVDFFRKTLGATGRIDIIKNERKYGEVENTLDTLRNHPWCKDETVICRLDGGDYLCDVDALVYVNHAYETEKCEFLWTKQRWQYHDHLNISGPMGPDEDPYTTPWRTSHMKTYKKYLINNINDANFRGPSGDYAMIGCDQFMSLPLLKNTKRRYFLDRTVYHYSIPLEDKNLFISDRSIKQKESAEWLRQRGYIP